MKLRFFVYAAGFFFVLCPLASWPVQGSWSSSPLGSSTVPPSSISSGLVNTPDPIDTAGNLLITGNVRRGMYFQGNVPYQSPTSFNSTLGSSALSSFLRDSAGPEDFGSYSQTFRPQPYYSPTETVTMTTPGRSEVFSPASVWMNARAQQDARAEGTGAFGPDASPMVPMAFNPGRAAELAAQGPRPQYYLFEDSRWNFEDGLSLSPVNPAERLTSGWAGPGREERAPNAERFANRVQGQEAISSTQTTPASDSSLGLGLDSAVSSPEQQRRWPTPDSSFQYLNSSRSIEALRSQSGTQIPAVPDADVKQSAAGGDPVANSNELTSSATPALREESALQKNVNWPGTSLKLLAGQYPDSVGNETANVERVVPSASVAQNGVPLQEGTDRSQRDVLERIKKQLEDLTRSVEAGLQNTPGDPTQNAKTASAAKPETPRVDSQSLMSNPTGAAERAQIDSSGQLSLYTPQSIISGFGDKSVSAPASESQAVPGVELPQMDALVPPAQKETSALDKFRQLSQANVSAEARRVMGSHTSLESLGIARFNEHVRSAEEHLRAGRYYRAADAFAMASVYKPDDPLALAGRSHALFAAGEYVSSALFLSRTLAICPEYLQVRVDLTSLLGGQEKVAQRLADVEQWYARSGSGQLQLLLGYVYYRTGNLTQARRAVDSAYEKMPELLAARAMKAALDVAAR